MNNLQNFYLNILIIDDRLEYRQDFIKILKGSTQYENQLDILGSQIFGENYKNNSPIEVELPKIAISTASYGLEAIKIIQGIYKTNKQLALVFIDIHIIPEITRRNTIRSIWEIDKDIQIVVCTSLDDFIWKNILKSFEINDNLLILQKPFDYTIVRQLIYTLSKKWLLMQESKHYNQTLESRVQKRTKTLEYKANHDPLTSLPNRYLLEDRLSQLIKISKENNLMFAVLYMDLDNFKWINDNYTHEIGDQILQILTKKMLHNTRRDDDFFRIGGDEFVLIITNIATMDNVNNIVKNLLSIINQPIQIETIDIEMQISIGISIYPLHGTTSSELLKNSDLAMYKAKGSGGNKCEYYNKELYITNKANLDFESALQQALINEEFFLCYLPQIELASKKLNSLEALIRWNHPKLGVIPATGFIPYAEKHGHISSINAWVIKKVIAQNKIWSNKGLNIVPISVNVGLQQIRQDNFLKDISYNLQKNNLKPNYFGIDITENSYINSDEIINIINNIKKLGVQITLDNFGTGNMPLNYLKKLQIDFLKIDRSFISNMETDPNNKVIIESIINIANSLKLKIIAVGIETVQHKDFFKQHNCKYVEGYYFSKPLSANQLELLLR